MSYFSVIYLVFYFCHFDVVLFLGTFIVIHFAILYASFPKVDFFCTIFLNPVLLNFTVLQKFCILFCLLNRFCLFVLTCKKLQQSKALLLFFLWREKPQIFAVFGCLFDFFVGRFLSNELNDNVDDFGNSGGSEVKREGKDRGGKAAVKKGTEKIKKEKVMRCHETFSWLPSDFWKEVYDIWIPFCGVCQSDNMTDFDAIKTFQQHLQSPTFFFSRFCAISYFVFCRKIFFDNFLCK